MTVGRNNWRKFITTVLVKHRIKEVEISVDMFQVNVTNITITDSVYHTVCGKHFHDVYVDT